uniref:Uncharacterized protein n=1 Tax=Phakopsora pachyrhizi TaxID=170000 RepID=A0A0S1MIQ7_PHAPC
MGFIVTFLGVYLLNICRTDPGGTANNVSSLERSLESGVIHPRMSLNGTRLSLSSDRENQLTHHPIHKSYHRSSGGLPSPSNPFGNNNSAGGGNKKSGGRRMGLYDHRNHSQDSVLFEAFPEESVGLTLMNNTSDEEEEDGSIGGVGVVRNGNLNIDNNINNGKTIGSDRPSSTDLNQNKTNNELRPIKTMRSKSSD